MMQLNRIAWAVATTAVLAGGAAAQDGLSPDDRELIDQLMQRIEKRLAQHRKELLTEVKRLLDERLKPGESEGSGGWKPYVPTRQYPPPGGFLGISPTEADRGVRIESLVDGGPAEAAGLREGDVIFEIDGQDARSPEALRAVLSGRGPGKSVRVRAYRGEDELNVKAKLGVRPAESEVTPMPMPLPPAPPEAPEPPRPARKAPKAPAAPKVQPVPPAPPTAPAPPTPPTPPADEPRSKERVPGFLGIQGEDADGGVRIGSLVSGSPAEKAGLQAGDVITGINRKPVANVPDLVEHLRVIGAGRSVRVAYTRGGESATTMATLVDSAAMEREAARGR